jgi:hypothetical protein
LIWSNIRNILDTRGAAISQIEEKISELSGIFSQLASMVSKQEGMFANTESEQNAGSSAPITNKAPVDSEVIPFGRGDDNEDTSCDWASDFDNGEALLRDHATSEVAAEILRELESPSTAVALALADEIPDEMIDRMKHWISVLKDQV